MHVEAIRWDGERLWLLDQRRLPHEVTYLPYQLSAAVAEAIAGMVVRGAPAIGIAAAYGAVLAAREAARDLAPGDGPAWLAAMAPALDVLRRARPTAVNLGWAVGLAEDQAAQGGEEVPARLERLARYLHAQDIDANRRMGELGAALLARDSVVYTHCNAGALATGGFGTALGVIRAGFAGGRISHVYAGETRPWLQGSRLTAWELAEEGIPYSLLVDGAAAHLMKTTRLDWVIVGADRVAANGDVCNKIGTYGLAVLARHHGVRFMAVLPTSTVDMSLASGHEIPIEQRAATEVTQWAGTPVAPPGAAAINPAFDVTPADLVDAIVTERGVIERPDAGGMARLFEKEFATPRAD